MFGTIICWWTKKLFRLASQVCTMYDCLFIEKRSNYIGLYYSRCKFDKVLNCHWFFKSYSAATDATTANISAAITKIDLWTIVLPLSSSKLDICLKKRLINSWIPDCWISRLKDEMNKILPKA